MRNILPLLLICFTFYLQGQEFRLSINFEGLESNTGKLLMKIVDGENDKVSQAILDISNRSASKSILLPAGKYAVSCFHDADNNQKLSTNFMGIPNEEYGFSNDARGTFGPPELQDQLIVLDKNKNIKIKLK